MTFHPRWAAGCVLRVYELRLRTCQEEVCHGLFFLDRSLRPPRSKVVPVITLYIPALHGPIGSSPGLSGLFGHSRAESLSPCISSLNDAQAASYPIVARSKVHAECLTPQPVSVVELWSGNGCDYWHGLSSCSWPFQVTEKVSKGFTDGIKSRQPGECRTCKHWGRANSMLTWRSLHARLIEISFSIVPGTASTSAVPLGGIPGCFCNRYLLFKFDPDVSDAGRVVQSMQILREGQRHR